MAYTDITDFTHIFVFGDSLVDAGNALGLAEWYGDLTFSDLPDGAPTEELGYFEGRFSDGYAYADLLSNKAVGIVSEPVFPFGYVDPWLGIEIAPFKSEPDSISQNHAYGGAQVRGGDEAGLDLDEQTDAFRDAVDGDAPPGGLYIVTMGGNDVRNLAKVGSPPADELGGYAVLDKVVQQLIHELGQLIDDGARNFLITGMPDVGIIPDYDVDHNGILDAAEQARADGGTMFAAYLDLMIRTEVVPALEGMGATVTYVPMTSYEEGGATVTAGLDLILPTIEALNGLAPGTLTTDLLTYQELVFFDDVHPNAQVQALFGSYAQALLTGAEWIETLPLADADYAATASIAVAGEVDKTVFVLAAGTEYRFDMLGVSSLGAGWLGDPSLRLVTASGIFARANDDSGAGFDAVLTFTAAEAGNYVLRASAVGSLTGGYELQASVIGGAAMLSGQTYVVNNAAWVVLEGVGGAGIDVILASTSYALQAGSEIELLTTTSDKARGTISLTGNEFDQQIIGNAGVNILDGKGGADIYTGGAGKDVFVLSGGAADTITDYAKGDIVDVSQVLSVAAGTNAVSGGYVRVTTSGLIQVDANGGGDQWTTLSHVNGNGAVAIRYASGGVLTTAQVGRVAETTLLAASAAAAGMAALTQPQAAGVAETGQLLAPASNLAIRQEADAFGQFALAEALALPAMDEAGFERPVAEPARHNALVERIAFEPVEAMPDHGAMPLLEATELVAPPVATAAAEIAMPSAAMAAGMAQILADALGSSEGGPDVAVLLEAVLAGSEAPGLVEVAAFAPAMPLLGLEMLAVHADAVATV